MQSPGVKPRTPLAWATNALPLSHDIQTTTNPHNPLYICTTIRWQSGLNFPWQAIHLWNWIHSCQRTHQVDRAEACEQKASQCVFIGVPCLSLLLVQEFIARTLPLQAKLLQTLFDCKNYPSVKYPPYDMLECTCTEYMSNHTQSLNFTSLCERVGFGYETKFSRVDQTWRFI